MVLEGAKRLIKQGDFTKSEVIENIIKDFSEESNSVKMFFEEEDYYVSKTNCVKRSDLHKMYVEYCKAHGQRPVNTRNFAQRLRELEFEVIERGNQGYAWVYCEKEINPKYPKQDGSAPKQLGIDAVLADCVKFKNNK